MDFRLAIAIVALLQSACFKEKQDLDPSFRDYAANRTPTVSGIPPTDIRAGLSYEFIPVASDPDGDALKFRIANKPAWAQFDTTSGRLSGTPQETDVGITAEIRISVTDGMRTAVIPEFAITVNQVAMGSVTLSWYPPTQNADGSPLTDLAGYRIYYGRNADSLDQVMTLNNAGLTAIDIENLSSATWHFSMTSYNTKGAESSRSSTVSKTIS